MKTVVLLVCLTLSLRAQNRLSIPRQSQLAALMNANLNSSPDRQVWESPEPRMPEKNLITFGPSWRTARVYKKPRVVAGSTLHLLYQKKVVALGFSRSALLGIYFSFSIRNR